MTSLPVRPRTHVLGDYAERFVEIQLPREWIVRKVDYDYGLDLMAEIVSDGQVTGRMFSIQVKATNAIPITSVSDMPVRIVTLRLKASTVEYMKSRLEPVILVLYVEVEREAYWIWADEITSSTKADITVRFPLINPLSTTDWRRFAAVIEIAYKARKVLQPALPEDLTRFGRYSIDFARTDPRLTAREVDTLEHLIHEPSTTEADLQRFIEQHPKVFIGGEYLEMHGQVRLETATETLIPDFLLGHVSGLCDILELKLPAAKVVVGAAPRRRYSAAIAEAAAQTRVYRDFFDESEKRKWFEEKYKLRAYKPRTILLIGRDTDFRDAKEKRELEVMLHDYRLLTYDDLLRMARAQQSQSSVVSG